MMHFEELRRRYPVFKYERFDIDWSSSQLTTRFSFSIPPDITFTPEVHFEPVGDGWHSTAEQDINNAVFHLGLIESFSYWKATASPTIEIRAGSLSIDQVRWWKDLLIHGMGEYFYRNDIDFTRDDLVQIVFDGHEASFDPYAGKLPDRTLLTIGGGRDSALAAGLLRQSGHPFTCMMLNPSTAAARIAQHVSPADPVVIRRAIHPSLLKLNRRGFLNGHTPFSAYLGFLGAVCLPMYGYSNIVVANERSSDEGNLRYRGGEINHQYSKSFRFEQLFDEYLSTYVVAGGRYFSFLRPLFELQIGKLFSGFPELFERFTSCNRNRSNTWCGRCPKCVSVFLTMYPFVPHSMLMKVFGMDLFQREETIPVLLELVGVGTKPFECVATRDEVIGALALSIAKARGSGEPLPRVLDYAMCSIPGATDTATASALLESYGPHRIPVALESFLTNALKSSPRSR
jgi:hypothetical protein